MKMALTAIRTSVVFALGRRIKYGERFTPRHLPYYAVAFLSFAAIFENVPYVRRFSTQADRDISVETPDGID